MKYQEFKLKALKARNEYLLCVHAANAALHKYYAEDLSDLIDVFILILYQSFRLYLLSVYGSWHATLAMRSGNNGG